MVRTLFLHLRRELAAAAHEGGALFHYFTQTGIMPLLEDYRELGVDVLSALDTHPGSDDGGAVDLREVKRRIGDAVCLWGGVSADHVVELGTPEQVRQAVAEAVAICAHGGGYVLSLSGSVYRADDAARRNVLAVIEAAREAIVP
jgi:uroporphyrinogen decarboxylase